MTVAEIKACVRAYVQAAENAIRAGFDGVEIHGADLARLSYCRSTLPYYDYMPI
jgi:hypothetical protein